MRSIAAVLNFSRNIVPLFKHCCGARVGAGGAEIIWDLEPEPKFFLQIYPTVSLENPWMKKNLFWDLFLIVLTEIMDIGGIGAENK